MTQYLPPNLLALFAPRDPIPFLSQLSKLPHEKKSTDYTGIGTYVQQFEVSRLGGSAVAVGLCKFKIKNKVVKTIVKISVILIVLK